MQRVDKRDERSTACRDLRLAARESASMGANVCVKIANDEVLSVLRRQTLGVRLDVSVSFARARYSCSVSYFICYVAARE